MSKEYYMKQWKDWLGNKLQLTRKEDLEFGGKDE